MEELLYERNTWKHSQTHFSRSYAGFDNRICGNHGNTYRCSNHGMVHIHTYNSNKYSNGTKGRSSYGFLRRCNNPAKVCTCPLSPFDVFFINPLVSVLPRIFIGVVPYLVYKLFSAILGRSSNGEKVAILVAGASGAITNTALVMTALYLVFVQEIVDLVGIPFKTLLISIITTNAVTEALIAAILTLPVVLAYKKINR